MDMDMDEYKEAKKVGLAMQTRGGSFVNALGEALQRADMENAEKLKEAFPDYFKVYSDKLDEGHIVIDYNEKDILTPEQLEGLKHDLDKLKDKFSEQDIDSLAERIDNTKKLLYGGEE